MSHLYSWNGFLGGLDTVDVALRLVHCAVHTCISELFLILRNDFSLLLEVRAKAGKALHRQRKGHILFL